MKRNNISSLHEESEDVEPGGDPPPRRPTTGTLSSVSQWFRAGFGRKGRKLPAMEDANEPSPALGGDGYWDDDAVGPDITLRLMDASSIPPDRFRYEDDPYQPGAGRALDTIESARAEIAKLQASLIELIQASSEENMPSAETVRDATEVFDTASTDPFDEAQSALRRLRIKILELYGRADGA